MSTNEIGFWVTSACVLGHFLVGGYAFWAWVTNRRDDAAAGWMYTNRWIFPQTGAYPHSVIRMNRRRFYFHHVIDELPTNVG